MPDNSTELALDAAESGATLVAFEIVPTDTPYLTRAVGIDTDNGLQEEYFDDEEFQDNPRRAKGTRTVADVASFLAELARRPLGDEGTLWGNADRSTITAVYNDHTNRSPGWRDDNLTLQLPRDPDWSAWQSLSGQYSSQEVFGDRLEELRHTIVTPDQADLLEIVDSIRASVKGEFNSEIDRAKGGQKLTYKKEVSAKAGAVGRTLEVPQTITLKLTPWDGHDTFYEVQAYFRLNITEGALRIGVKLFPTRQLLRAAWADLTKGIVDDIGKPVYAQP